jgi:uncharacterized radical SAM protein YgiQ
MSASKYHTRFIPTTREDMQAQGWEELDIILVSGDTYIDAPQIGVAVIGRILLDAGYRVGIIAQPDIKTDADIARLGEPTLFWGVTAGSVDAMIANHTSTNRPRRMDDLTPGGRNDRRPDRATIVYANLIRRHFKNTARIVLGGIEASLRRISHYDAWTDRIRRAILFDAKADYLVYGMAEKSVLELAGALDRQQDPRFIRGLCYIDSAPPTDDGLFPGEDIQLPDHSDVQEDKQRFARMFSLFYANADPHMARRLYQKQDTRYLIHNPPQRPLSTEELDRVYELPYVYEPHPYYARMGKIAAMDTLRYSLTSHRGCFGECRFCAIAVHQGRQVISRSQASLIREATAMTLQPGFKGIISNVGGPTANMYAMTCERMTSKGACPRKGCLFPRRCTSMKIDHGPQIELLAALRRVKGVRKVFIGSGLRHDLIVADTTNGRQYLDTVVRHHASGQLKIAPEHVSPHVLDLMGKPGEDILEQFHHMFNRAQQKSKLKIFLTYYLMAAHPGCTMEDMRSLRGYALGKIKTLPEQVQIFTPSPSTYATLMYHTETDPFSGRKIMVEKTLRSKQDQKAVVQKKSKSGRNRKHVHKKPA